jgi:hypothetical protein
MRLQSAILHGAIIMSLFLTAAMASARHVNAKGNVPAGHKWSYVYQHGVVNLTVSVGEWNTKTMRFIKIYRTDHYKFPCQENRSGETTCDMDIKSSILESYQKAGLNGSVGDSEAYASIETIATGTWNSLDHPQQPVVLAGHSTVGFAVQTPNNSSVIFRGFSPSDPKLGAKAWSTPFNPQGSTLYEMAATHNEENPPSVGSQGFYTKTPGPVITPLGTAAHDSSPFFELTRNQLVISPVDGFELQSFSVDPRMGSGG